MSFVNLALKTEYSFKKCFGRVRDIHNHTNGEKYIGIADLGTTYGHIKLEKVCKENGLKPIYGVRLQVVEDKNLRIRGKWGPNYIIIARNNEGLVELYGLVKKAWENFYYKALLPLSDLLNASENVLCICDNPLTEERLDYLALTPSTPKCVIGIAPPVFINDNFYSTVEDKQTYQLFCGARKHGDDFRYLFEDQTYPMHILKEEEFKAHYDYLNAHQIEQAILNTKLIAQDCNATIKSAPMVKYHSVFSIKLECQKGAKKLGVDLNEPETKARFEKELKLIKEKEYEDYFMIVSEMIRKAKKKMLVGPGRGSAAGSLVCYLLEITTINPLDHGLIFERFIDVNRSDLPDIDIDFPDDKRQIVIKDLFKTYGKENVYHISNINTLGARSALDEFGMALSIPRYKIEQVKEHLIERTIGDARSNLELTDTLEQTEIGKNFVQEYPKINLAKKAEGHAAHAGKHAAGIIVCNDDLTNYCGINAREDSIMYDKKDAEEKNLLKIDCLGLRTLTILEEAAKIVGKKIDFYYDLELDDEKTFEIFKKMRLSGVFQFEGQSAQQLCRQMKVETFDDIVAINALARPGPLSSGEANLYAKRRNKEEPIAYTSSHEFFVEETKNTMGIILYQEQLMNICRNIGDMDWPEVSEIRKKVSKSMGAEHLNEHKENFINGAIENKLTEVAASDIWNNLLAFGSYGFNLSHAVSYAYLSYWCAYMKRHHPLAFTVATLNHASSEKSAIKILRDAVENDGLEYIAVDPDESDVFWSISASGKMLGGLTNIKGIAEKKAKEIIKKRNDTESFTPGLIDKLLNPVTPYDILYPTKHYWGQLYENPEEYGLVNPPAYISDINENEDRSFTIIGKIIEKDLRDLNEYSEVVKRNGQMLAENNLFLRLIVEDDTGQILCKINRFKFEKMRGHYYSEHLIVDESWVIVRGTISKGWRILDINAIFDLKQLEL